MTHYTLDDFDFHLPPQLIAQHPLPNRTESRLLCLNKTTGDIQHRSFADLPTFLCENDLLVFNNTKVIPARLFGFKDTGGKIECLIERIISPSSALVHLRASKAPKIGAAITICRSYESPRNAQKSLSHSAESSHRHSLETSPRRSLGGGNLDPLSPQRMTDAQDGIKDQHGVGKGQQKTSHEREGIKVIVADKTEDLYTLTLASNLSCNFFDIVNQCGHMPLPPYIKREDTAFDETRYQTVYAKKAGAIAAPTAGLHFDEALLQKIESQDIAKTELTLHVGSGTFQPVRVKDFKSHVMHKEYFELSGANCDAVIKTQQKQGRIIAVGTTVVRTLEAVAQQFNPIQPLTGDTQLFIYPGFEFRSVDVLLTNFHLPKSTLLMLVSAFGGYDHIMQVYQEAIKEKYRFFSYGDAMFIY